MNQANGLSDSLIYFLNGAAAFWRALELLHGGPQFRVKKGRGQRRNRRNRGARS